MAEQNYQQLQLAAHSNKLFHLLPLLQKLIGRVGKDDFSARLMKFFAVANNDEIVTEYSTYLFIYGDFYRGSSDDSVLAGIFVKLDWFDGRWTFDPEDSNSYLLTESQQQQWNIHQLIEHSGPEGAFFALMATKHREEEARLAKEQERNAGRRVRLSTKMAPPV